MSLDIYSVMKKKLNVPKAIDIFTQLFILDDQNAKNVTWKINSL